MQVSRHGILTSVFEMFKIGIGPSSSHTVGPMKACAAFAQGLINDGVLEKVAKVQVQLYGSLCLTGKGHSTDTACVYGLIGQLPDSIDLKYAQTTLDNSRKTKKLRLGGFHDIAFCELQDIHWIPQAKPYHPNALTLRALDSIGGLIKENTYYSIGGGFIQDQAEIDAGLKQQGVPNIEQKNYYKFTCANDLLRICKTENLNFSDVILHNEQVLYDKSKEEVYAKLDQIWGVMSDCVHRGLNSTEEYLPGKLKVKRRAPSLKKKLESTSKTASHFKQERSLDIEMSVPLAQLPGMTLVSIYALAVGEENAAGHRVVTAPTNGACGIIPAVIKYSVKELIVKNFHGISPRLKYESVEHAFLQAPRDFLLTAAGVGMLYKHNASLSGAESGCQGEVGVATSMASAGLCEILGGTPAQVERAAEIGMEHSLGLTCDPVGGLVQIPCMERNAVSANKAVNAASMAILTTDESHKVSLDQVIRVMKRTGDEMSSKYKETSLGGLALEFDIQEEEMLRSGFTVDKPAC